MKKNGMRSSGYFPSKAENNAPKRTPMIGTTEKKGFTASKMAAKPVKNEAIHVRKVAAPSYSSLSSKSTKGFANKSSGKAR